MKTAISFMSTYSVALFLVSNVAVAAPVLDNPAATGEAAVVYPDHLDPNKYYLSPTSLVLATAAGRPMLRYDEFYVGRKGGRRKAASLEMILKVWFDEKVMGETKNEILRQNPNAKFAPIPMLKTFLIKRGLARFIVKGSCSHTAGNVSQYQDCNLELTPRGRQQFLAGLKNGDITTLSFGYIIPGVQTGENGAFVPVQVTRNIGAFIYADDIKKHTGVMRRL